jgi:thioesterase domain-containing protein
MAAHYIKEIREVQPKGPYYLGGSSLGGLIAYEVGSQLRESGEEVRLIALIDTYAPGYPKRVPGTSKLSLKLLGYVDRIHHHIDTLWIIEPGKRWPYFVAKAIKARNQIRRTYIQTKRKIARRIVKGLGRPLPESLVITQNAIGVAAKAYNPSPYQGPIILFRASKQFRGIYREDTLGWSNFAKGIFEIHEVNGSHGSIVAEPRVRFVAEVLQDILDGSRQIGEKLDDK